MIVMYDDMDRAKKVLKYKGQKILVDTKDIPTLISLMTQILKPIDPMESEELDIPVLYNQLGALA